MPKIGEIKKRKKFDGKYFTLMTNNNTQKAAEDSADWHKKVRGAKTRIVEGRTKRGKKVFRVYTRVT